MKKFITLFLTGCGVGITTLIPGLSGGAVILVVGVYEELLTTIKKITGDVATFLLQGNVGEAWRIMPFYFIVPFLLGFCIAIVSLATILSMFFSSYPIHMWALIFGLVFASALVILQRIPKLRIREVVLCILSGLLFFFLVGIIPFETPHTLFFIFLSGVLAICALLMPGISGSFVLVLLGKYQYLLAAVIDRNIQTLAIFMAGCILGVALFSRVLSWLFKKHHDISVAVIAGCMFGSLRKIWPWRESNLQFDTVFLTAVFLCVIGMSLVFYIEGRKRSV